MINASPIVVVNSEIQKLCELSTQMVFGANTGFGANTAFGANTVCELFPHIHTEGFCCVHNKPCDFHTNLHAVCQPNGMQICGNIIMNLHHVLWVKVFSQLCKFYKNRTSSIDVPVV